jgi:hypothetical protein
MRPKCRKTSWATGASNPPARISNAKNLIIERKLVAMEDVDCKPLSVRKSERERVWIIKEHCTKVDEVNPRSQLPAISEEAFILRQTVTILTYSQRLAHWNWCRE